MLISSTSSNYQLTRKNIDNILKRTPYRSLVIFGNPALMEKFNDVTRKTAPEFNAEYYDIYSAMKAMPQEEKAKLLNKYDGVHLSDAGQNYLAMLYLKYLANIR